MKILFLGLNKLNDYAQDCLFHGLYKLYGNNVVDSDPLNFMFKDAPKLNPEPRLHGKGFTLYHQLLGFHNTNRENCIEKSINNFYDLIVFASIRRKFPYSYSYLNNIKTPIAFVDGEDDAMLDARLFNRWIYFKRELVFDSREISNLFPFPLSVPLERCRETINENPKHTLAPLIPYDEKTYIYNDDVKYLEMYANSIFGLAYGALTHYPRGTKPQWDSYRFYEMMSQGCIPLIPNLEQCPKNCCVNLPKELLVSAYKKYHYVLTKKVDINKILQEPEMTMMRKVILQHARDHCTTIECAKNFIKKVSKFFNLTADSF